jgi:hypothetical protein
MQARKLRKILNDTEYTISNSGDCICIGSSCVHDLISVDKKTFRVEYAFDTFNKGREAIKHEELLFIWDTLHRLIETGEIHEIIEGKDVIENPLPVFTVNNGELAESITDKYGWPNTDDDGVVMYDNTHFQTKMQALKYGIEELSAREKRYDRMIKKHEKEIARIKPEKQEVRLKLETLIKKMMKE